MTKDSGIVQLRFKDDGKYITIINRKVYKK